MQLTGLDVEENQAQRLLNDLDSFRIKVGLGREDEEIAAHRWVTERFERVMSEVPPAMRGKLEPAQIFHEVLEHRWFMSEREGCSVPFEDCDQRLRHDDPRGQARRAGRARCPRGHPERRHRQPPHRAASGDRRVTEELRSLVVIAAIAAFVPLVVGLFRIKVAEVVLLLGAGHRLRSRRCSAGSRSTTPSSCCPSSGSGCCSSSPAWSSSSAPIRGQSGKLAAIGWGLSLVVASLAAIVMTATGQDPGHPRRRHRADVDGPGHPAARCCGTAAS